MRISLAVFSSIGCGCVLLLIMPVCSCVWRGTSARGCISVCVCVCASRHNVCNITRANIWRHEANGAEQSFHLRPHQNEKRRERRKHEDVARGGGEGWGSVGLEPTQASFNIVVYRCLRTLGEVEHTQYKSMLQANSKLNKLFENLSGYGSIK